MHRMPGGHVFLWDPDEGDKVSGKTAKETSCPWKGGRKDCDRQVVMGFPVPEKEVDDVFENA